MVLLPQHAPTQCPLTPFYMLHYLLEEFLLYWWPPLLLRMLKSKITEIWQPKVCNPCACSGGGADDAMQDYLPDVPEGSQAEAFWRNMLASSPIHESGEAWPLPASDAPPEAPPPCVGSTGVLAPVNVHCNARCQHVSGCCMLLHTKRCG